MLYHKEHSLEPQRVSFIFDHLRKVDFKMPVLLSRMSLLICQLAEENQYPKWGTKMQSF